MNQFVCISIRLLETTIFESAFPQRAPVAFVDLIHDFFPGCAGVDMKKMESKNVEGLFFAGELLDVDGITGGCVSLALVSLMMHLLCTGLLNIDGITGGCVSLTLSSLSIW